MVSVAVATDTEERTVLQNLADLAAVVATSATGVVDPSATSATGLVTLPASAGRKKIGATSATAPATSRGTAARTRTPATTATRCPHCEGLPQRWDQDLLQVRWH